MRYNKGLRRKHVIDLRGKEVRGTNFLKIDHILYVCIQGTNLHIKKVCYNF